MITSFSFPKSLSYPYPRPSPSNKRYKMVYSLFFLHNIKSNFFYIVFCNQYMQIIDHVCGQTNSAWLHDGLESNVNVLRFASDNNSNLYHRIAFMYCTYKKLLNITHRVLLENKYFNVNILNDESK